MEVEVQLFASLQTNRFRNAWIELLEGARIAELLAELKISSDEVGILVVNGRSATFEQSLDPQDKITIIPPIGGG